MDEPSRPRRSRGSPAMAAGMVAVVQLGVLNVIWTAGFAVPVGAPLGPLWFVVVNWLAVVIVAAGVVVRARSIRLSRLVVLAAAVAVIVVAMWLAVVVATAPSESLLVTMLILWVALLAAGLVGSAVDRSPAGADRLRPR